MMNPILRLSLLLLSTAVVHCNAEAPSFLETLQSESRQLVDHLFGPQSRHLQSTYDPNEMADFSSVTLDDMLDKIMEASGFDPATGCAFPYNNRNRRQLNEQSTIRQLNEESTIIDDPEQLKGMESLTVNDLLDMITGVRNHRDPPVIRIIVFREQLGVYNPDRRQRCGRQHRGHHAHKNDPDQPQQRVRGSGRKVKTPHQRFQGGSHPRPGQGGGNPRPQGGNPRPRTGGGNPRPGGHPRPQGGNPNQGRPHHNP